MSNPLRITKIICPSCEGTGQFRMFGDFDCLWCKGAKRLPVKDARRYADVVWTFAGGDYIAGGSSYEEKIAQEEKAEKIYELTGSKAPWLHKAAQ